jgi:hypothetical protein
MILVLIRIMCQLPGGDNGQTFHHLMIVSSHLESDLLITSSGMHLEI